MTRDQFREEVFRRDGHRCVVCGAAPEDTPEGKLDAHHILERRLWTTPGEQGGYFLNNGATVCEKHHLACEKTLISVEEIRELAGIKKAIIPSHLYDDTQVDKWGNTILEDGRRLPGELFWDESVQKVLADVLDQFTHLVKYPRTSHLPWSPGMHDDDRRIDSMCEFVGKRVIATAKMDGENTSLYSDYIHARSLDGRNHESRSWVKNFWSQICGDIPEHWRLCGENLYAKHSIRYDDLSSYFMGFSLWNEKNVCLSWDETQEWFELLGVTSVPVLYDGIYDEETIKKLWTDADYDTSEGYVLRVADEFAFKKFRHCVGKFVRPNHVQTTRHWKYGQRVEPNGLAGQ